MISKWQNVIKVFLVTLMVSLMGIIIVPQVSYGLEKNELDVSTGWEVLDYTSSLNVGIDKVFAEGQVSLSGVKYATTNFFNIGKSHFKATKTIPMKKGNIYSFDLVYALRPQGKASGYIDFNGTMLTETKLENTPYTERVVPSEDQNYIITMEFTVPKNTGMFLMVGQGPNGGIHVNPVVEIPTVNTPEAGTEKVFGTGKSGNTIKIMDAADKIIGTGVVKEDNTFEITTDRILLYNECLTVTQTNEAEESSPINIQVKDTIAPEVPEIQNIYVKEQLVKGTAEINNTIEVRNGNGILIGTGKTSDEGKVSIELSTAVTLSEYVSITAIDEAGNRSMPAIVTVISDEQIPPAPSVKNPEAGTNLVMGSGVNGNTIKIMDSSNNVIGTGKVNQFNEFEVKTNRPLVYKELLKISQVDNLANESEFTNSQVQDTIAPNIPKIQDIIESNQQIIGTSEPNSRIEVRDKDGNLIGIGTTTADGKVSFKLAILLKEFQQVSIIAIDEAGNKSDATIMTVRSNLVSSKPDFTKKDESKYALVSSVGNLENPLQSRKSSSINKNIINRLPTTGERVYKLKTSGILLAFIAICMIIVNKKKKRGSWNHE
ncbi:hypothetical protein CMALT430_320003 [Carnobacterium maltaromaticum]|uniref:Ig-like domain-containing protein n=1 Tax=Carnobacterium maltaromaticum TaxID=2751 RepID=UPI00191BB4A9|nr:Ig-like domain-containing protein [Carnobacterium maltaromaticum]CAD5900448.1 hypothetical protein CMALT430_320003 [Carnobacterium maltaromaticum]